MKDLGATKQILSMRITRDKKNHKLTLCQSEYIENVLKRFNMHNAKIVTTPLASHFKLTLDGSEVDSQVSERYHKSSIMIWWFKHCSIGTC